MAVLGLAPGKPRRWLCALIVLTLVGLAGTGTALASLTTERHYCARRGARYHGRQPFVGINAPDLGVYTITDEQCTAGRIAADWLGDVRAELSWEAVETSPGSYNFAFYDQLMTVLAEHDLQWLPVVEDAPGFLARGGRNPDGGLAPPANPSQFGDFVRMMVRRYGPGGSFWRMHPKLPYDPVRAWQIWNEPVLTGYWEPRPSPEGYTQLLRATWRAVKPHYPHTVLVAAGDPFYQGIKFYRQILRDGAGRYFDVAAWHDYSAKLVYAKEYLTLLRQALDSAGLRRTPIWVTEWGWGTGRRRRESTAERLDSGLLRFMVSRRAELRLGRVFYFEWRDFPTTPINGVYLGLYRDNDTPRPVARLIASAARRLNR